MNTENEKNLAKFLDWKIDEEIGNYLVPMSFIVSGDHKEWADTKFINEIGYYLLSENQLCFTFDWNWLMKVVEKIENIKDENCFILYDVIISPDSTRITDQNENDIINVGREEFESKITFTYNACLEFIKWYLENSAKEN